MVVIIKVDIRIMVTKGTFIIRLAILNNSTLPCSSFINHKPSYFRIETEADSNREEEFFMEIGWFLKMEVVVHLAVKHNWNNIAIVQFRMLAIANNR